MNEEFKHKKVILIGNEENNGLSYIDKEKNIMKETYILSAKGAEDSKIFKYGKPEDGMIYVRHPFLPIYLPNDSNLELNICKCSINHYFDFVYKLGARKCEYSLEFKERNWLKDTIETKVGTPQVEVEAKVETEAERNYRKSLNLEYNNRSLNGNFILSAEEYKKAKDFYEKSDYLRFQPECESLLECRNPKNNSQRTKESMGMTISQEMNDKLSIATSLKTLNGIKVNANYTNNKSIKRTISMKIVVTFE